MSWYDRFIAPFQGKRPDRPEQLDFENKLTWTPASAARGGAPRRVETPASFPRFTLSAGDQLDSRNADRFSTTRLKLRDAYTPSQPVTDRKLFAGRTSTLTTLIRAIEDQRLHTVIYGERGIGKTSLLHILASAAREARYLVVYISCGASSTFDEMIRGVVEHIPLLFHGDYGPTSPETEKGGTFADLLGDAPLTVRVASDLLHRVVGTRVLVILDEFDRIESDDFRFAVAELLKSLSDRSVRVQVVIGGVAANLNELIQNLPAIQRNILALPVPKMTTDEVRHLVKNGEEATGLAFDEAAIAMIAERCVGFPYLASLLSNRAGLAALDDGRMSVTAADATIATLEAVAEVRGRITRRAQVQLDECIADGMLGPLGTLAGIAQYAGGHFTQNDITGLKLGSEGQAKISSLIAGLSANRTLLEWCDDDLGSGYRFIEGTVPAYLWLRSTEERGDLASAAA